MNAIFQRRSIRQYTGEAISQEILLTFIKAGMAAPSARNQQLWQFILIQNREILNKIPEVHPYAAMVKNAAAAIVVCADMSLETSQGYWPQECGAATQNILLEVTRQGYGAVWLGVYPRTERVDGLKKLLNIPENVIPLSLIPVGVPKSHPKPKDIFNKDRIHFDNW